MKEIEEDEISEKENKKIELNLSKNGLEKLEDEPMENIKEDIDIFGDIEERRKNNKKSIYCTQTKAFMKKTILVFLRHYKTTILILSSPFLICIILMLLQLALETWSVAFIEKNPPLQTLGQIPRCPSPKDCTTIRCLILDRSENNENKEEVKTIMKYVSEKNNLVLGQDIVIEESFKTYTMFSQYLENHKNQTYFGVVFCYDNLDTEFYTTKINIPCKPQYMEEGKIYKFYTIVYNITNGPNDFLQMPYVPRQKDPKLMKLKLDIDNAFLEIFHNKTKNENKNNESEAPKIDIVYSTYPQTEHRFFGETSVVNNFGAPFFFLIPITLFILTLIDVVKEKQYKLRKSLLIIGLTNKAFWTSWFLVAFLFSAAIIFLFLAVVYILQWELFINTPFPLMFLLFFMITFDLQLCAFLMSTLLNNIKTAYAAAFCFIVVAAVIESIFTIPFLFQIIYADNITLGVYIFKAFLYIFCPYSFSKAFIEIATISSTKLNEVTFMNMVGRKYEYSDLFNIKEGDMVFFKSHYKIPATYESFILLFIDGIIYIIFIFYFDNVIEANRGKAKSPIFFIYKIGKLLGLYKPKKRKIGEEDDKIYFEELNRSKRESSLGGFNNSIEQNINQFLDNKMTTIKTNSLNPQKEEKMKTSIAKGYQTVIDEYNKIKNAEKNNIFLDGLRIVGASKTYNLSHGKKLKALENIFMDVSRGELLSLLGHNGAGKTTLINALCGNISITDGYAIINDVNITDENVKSKYKRQLIGLCPQHDILWDELTPYEHIELYASIRNYVKSDIKKIVEIKMKEVNLEHVTNDKVSTFSGGMKRRISILLSTVGNPNVVFLDEPSTGLDPVNRRFIWNMIKEIKKKSSVILTTHSMSEAEFLSDRICVIKRGTMQCIGTSLDLKKIYGDGYILTFICEKDCQENVKKIILGLSDNISLVSSKGGNLMFSLGFDKIGELNWFIKILNKDFSDEKLKSLKGLVKECGIEQTSIEEIFLKIAKEEGEEVDDGEIPQKD